MKQFVHLNVHSEYSIVDGLINIKSLVKHCVEDNQPAVSITDQCNLYAMVKFYNVALENGIKPILGSDMYIEDEDKNIFRSILLCQDMQGYINLSSLITKSYRDNQKNVLNNVIPIVSKNLLAEFNSGLIVLSGIEGDIGQILLSGSKEKLDNRLKWWQKHFHNRFFLELARIGKPEEEFFIQKAKVIANDYKLPVVATNQVRFMYPEDFEPHEVRVCVNGGYVIYDTNRLKIHTQKQYYRSTEEMLELFSDIPEAIENTINIAKRCNLSLNLDTYFLPDFSIPAGISMEDYFTNEAKKGLEVRLVESFSNLIPKEFIEIRQKYDKRLQFELKIISQMGFSGYFLIVADFIQWARDNDIPVGPGRGSGAGSLIAYSLKITDLDPLHYNLIFERFLNPERVSMPDFDIDFCMDRRDEVIEYVSKHYGKNHVSQIVTFGKMSAKAVIRDVGRVLGYNYGMVDSIAKLIPFDLGITLTEAMEKEEILKQKYDEDEDTKNIIDLSLKLEGTVRNTSKHAGGVVIGPKELEKFCPLQSEADGTSSITQLDKGDVESIGLVKFDFLGLRTLTIIDKTVKSINENNKNIDITKIPLDDLKTFDLIKTGNTTGIFQLESTGMQALIVKLKPDTLEDVIALVALFRPGPLESGMVDNYIARKHGKEPVSYPDAQYQHELLKPVLESTYGIIIYQEQVMQIAQVLAGYTLGEADLLRRAMGKKQPKEMEKQRYIFKEGAEKKGIDSNLAMKIFDLIERFAGYGFNRSHSAAYGLLSYQTAWLKSHYPEEFMAEQLSSDMYFTDKVVNKLEECDLMGIEVLPPDINTSFARFKVMIDKPKTLIFGLEAIKRVGTTHLEGIVEDREQNGEFKSLFDFCNRTYKKNNKRMLRALISSGAMDSLHNNRQTLLSNLSLVLQQVEQSQKDSNSGQADFFGDISSGDTNLKLSYVVDMSNKQRLQGEKEVLGIYVSGHPMDQYKDELKEMVNSNLSSLKVSANKVIIAGIVLQFRTKITKSGNKIGFILLDDGVSKLEIVLKSKILESVDNLIQTDSLILIHGKVKKDTYNGGLQLNVERIATLSEARLEKARAIKIHADDTMDIDMINKLFILLKDYQVDYVQQHEDNSSTKNGLPVVLEYSNKTAQGQVIIKSFKYVPEEELIEALLIQGWKPEIVF